MLRESQPSSDVYSNLQNQLHDLMRANENLEAQLASLIKGNKTQLDDSFSTTHLRKLRGNLQTTQPSQVSVSDELHEQVTAGLRRRDKDFVKEIFNKHCSKHENAVPRRGLILKTSIYTIHKELNVNVNEKEAEALYDEFDTDSSEGLDLQELQLLLQKPSRLHEWTKGLPLHELLADAVPRRQGLDPLRVVSGLTDEDISAVCEAVRNGLERMLKESSEFLKKAFHASDTRKDATDGSKFSIFPVSCGTIDDIYSGVEGRTGEDNQLHVI